MITFTLPMRPLSKLRPRLGKGGRVITPRATRTYERELALRAGVEPAKLRVQVAHAL